MPEKPPSAAGSEPEPVSIEALREELVRGAQAAVNLALASLDRPGELASLLQAGRRPSRRRRRSASPVRKPRTEPASTGARGASLLEELGVAFVSLTEA